MPIVPATPDAIRRAAQALARGEIVAFPTETVYGLAANALDPRAVAKVFTAKERPRFNPLIAHLADTASAFAEGVFDAAARSLAEAFWPGPLTLVVPAAPDCRVCDLARAGLPSVALRVPAPALTRALLARVSRDLSRVNAATLNSDGRTEFDAARRFVQQSEDALKARNLVYAGKLADKASAMAAVLVR